MKKKREGGGVWRKSEQQRIWYQEENNCNQMDERKSRWNLGVKHLFLNVHRQKLSYLTRDSKTEGWQELRVVTQRHSGDTMRFKKSQKTKYNKSNNRNNNNHNNKWQHRRTVNTSSNWKRTSTKKLKKETRVDTKRVKKGNTHMKTMIVIIMFVGRAPCHQQVKKLD